MRSAMVFWALFLFPVLFSVGLGEYDANKTILSYLRSTAESSLKMAIYTKHINSEASLACIHFLKGYENLESSSEMLSNSYCKERLALSDMFTNFSMEMKSISEPLNFWIHEISCHIDHLSKALEAANHAGQLSLSYFKFLPMYSETWSLNECYIPRPDEHENDLDFNDIVTYQKRNYFCSEEDSEFLCGSGECIHFNKTCDGTFNCRDGSDELGLCNNNSKCEGCEGVCVPGPRGPRCLATCPQGFKHKLKICRGSNECYNMCYRGITSNPLSTKCLIEILPNLVETVVEKSLILRNKTISNYIQQINDIHNCREKEILSSYEDRTIMDFSGDTTTIPTTTHPTTRYTTWHPTTRHSTWHPTTRHSTWHPTTRHSTWHPTTRHSTWHPTTRHSTWHPTTKHSTWHPTTRHSTWHPTTRHSTWHPTTRHSTWHPTTRHSTWHPTTRHSTWHPTTRHSTWHPTTRHSTWHPTTRHTTWHSTTGHSTWHPTTSSHISWPPSTPPTIWHETHTEFEEDDVSNTNLDFSTLPSHHSTKHTTHHTTKHTTHHTTKHTTQHTTKHTKPTSTTTSTTTLLPTTTISTTPKTTTSTSVLFEYK